MARNRDKSPASNVITMPRPATLKARPVRVIQIYANTEVGGFSYLVRVDDAEGEMLYASKSYVDKRTARMAATREHQGRNYEYILEWTDDRSGRVNRETL